MVVVAVMVVPHATYSYDAFFPCSCFFVFSFFFCTCTCLLMMAMRQQQRTTAIKCPLLSTTHQRTQVDSYKSPAARVPTYVATAILSYWRSTKILPVCPKYAFQVHQVPGIFCRGSLYCARPDHRSYHSKHACYTSYSSF